MSSPSRNEFWVGAFLLAGFALVGWLIFHFSRPHSTRGGGYPITVEVKDATGIRAGVPVRLGGVDIGRVSSDPVLNEDFVHLSVPLEIHRGARIPAGSTVKVGTSGLMGDSYVRIIPPDAPSGEFLPEGHRIVAETTSNLNDLAGEADQTLDEVASASAEMRRMADSLGKLTERFETEILTDENIANLRTILAEVRASSENLHLASKQLPQLLDDGRQSLDSVGTAANSAAESFARVNEGVAALTETLAETKPMLSEVGGAIGDLRETLGAADSLIRRIEKGNGLAAAFINDPSLKQDLADVLDKLNRFGPLFYPKEKDARKPEPPAQSAAKGPAEKRKPFSGLKRRP